MAPVDEPFTGPAYRLFYVFENTLTRENIIKPVANATLLASGACPRRA